MHLFAALLAYSVTLVIAILCLAWTPFAATECARIARQRCLTIKRPALHGAIYSFILFLPWRHLTRQMRGDPITRANITDAYTIAYVLAALVLAPHIFLIFAELIWPYAFDSLADLAKYGVPTFAGALAFAAGLASLSLAKNRLNQLQQRRESPNAIDLPDRSYIEPFAWAWASMLISSAPWWNAWYIILRSY